MAACLKLIFKTVFHATSAFIFQFSSVIQCQFSIFSVQKFNKTCYFYSNSVNFHYSLKLLPGCFEKYAWKKEPVRRTGSYRHEKHCCKHSGCIFAVRLFCATLCVTRCGFLLDIERARNESVYEGFCEDNRPSPTYSLIVLPCDPSPPLSADHNEYITIIG